MRPLMTFAALLGSVEMGVIYAMLSLGVFLSYRTLNTPDLTVDGSIVTGAAVGSILCRAGHPLWGLVGGAAAGAVCGAVTALLATRLRISPLLSGILVMMGLYSINLRILGGKANISLLGVTTIYHLSPLKILGEYQTLITSVLILLTVLILFYLFLKTRIGFALRGVGDNEDMMRSQGISTDHMKLLGMSVSNAMVGLCGAMLAQYQRFCDVGMGSGMVVIGLASLIVGEVVFGVKPLGRRLVAVALGAVFYRLVIAFTLQRGMPATDLKLISALVVTVAMSASATGGSLSKFFGHFSQKDRREAEDHA